MSDWNVSVAEILGRPGEYRDVSIVEPVTGIRTTLARLEETPVQAHLRAESVVEGVLITGRVHGRATLACARCLTDVHEDVDLEVCELFVSPGTELPEGEDAYELAGNEVRLEPMVRDAIALELPLNPLCEESCKGICARCGMDLNAGSCSCVDEDVDPRWAALDALKHRLETRQG